MIEELVFTSAPRGLQLGKSGYCTVASTPGMAANLARLLESLSGYRHLYAPGTPDANKNPVVYSHLKSKVGGRNFSILSRVADAEFDYSNRTNKLAHHLAIKETKAQSNGPSQLLLDESLFFTSWQQEPTKLNPRSISAETNIPMACMTWQTITGDAGWAGDVIEAVEKRRQVYLIINDSAPALKLINEMMSLLPIQKQWDVTFTTFFTKLPPSVECGIRCVMAGSPEVAVAKRSQANLVLDLTAPLGQSSSRHAEAARNGKLIKRSGNASTATALLPQIDRILENNDEHIVASDLPPEPAQPRWSIREVEEDYGLEEMPPELASRNRQAEWQDRPPSLIPNESKKTRKKWIALLLVFLVAGPVAAYLFYDDFVSLLPSFSNKTSATSPANPQVNKADEVRQQMTVSKADEEKEAARKAEEEKEAARKAEEEKDAARKAEEEEEKEAARKAEEEKEKEAARKAKEEKEAARKAKEERQANRVSVKNLKEPIRFKFIKNQEPSLLLQIEQQEFNEDDFDIQFVGKEKFDEKYRLITKKADNPDEPGNLAKWDVQLQLVGTDPATEQMESGRLGWLILRSTEGHGALEFESDSSGLIGDLDKGLELLNSSKLHVECFDGDDDFSLRPTRLWARNIGPNKTTPGPLFRTNEKERDGFNALVLSDVQFRYQDASQGAFRVTSSVETDSIEINFLPKTQRVAPKALLPNRRLNIVRDGEDLKYNWSLTESSTEISGTKIDLSFGKFSFSDSKAIIKKISDELTSVIDNLKKERLKNFPKEDPKVVHAIVLPFQTALDKTDTLKLDFPLPERLDHPIEITGSEERVLLFISFDNNQVWKREDMEKYLKEGTVNAPNPKGLKSRSRGGIQPATKKF